MKILYRLNSSRQPCQSTYIMKPKPKYVRLVDEFELMSHVVIDKSKPQFLFLLQPHQLVQMGGNINEKNELRGRVGLQSWPHFSPNEQVPVRVEAVAVVSELSPEFSTSISLTQQTNCHSGGRGKETHPPRATQTERKKLLTHSKTLS